MAVALPSHEPPERPKDDVFGLMINPRLSPIPGGKKRNAKGLCPSARPDGSHARSRTSSWRGSKWGSRQVLGGPRSVVATGSWVSGLLTRYAGHHGGSPGSRFQPPSPHSWVNRRKEELRDALKRPGRDESFHFLLTSGDGSGPSIPPGLPAAASLMYHTP